MNTSRFSVELEEPTATTDVYPYKAVAEEMTDVWVGHWDVGR
jgi:hypothetical protein